MRGYDYGYARLVSDHGRVIESGAWAGALAGVALLGWAGSHLPHLAAFVLDWTVILAVCYGMAAWKRAWYAWLAWWGMAAACVSCGILQLAGAMSGPWAGATWVMACVMVFIWYWLVRIPRKHPVVPDAGTHVYHHVIFHGQELPGWASAEVTGGPPGTREVIAGTAVREIEPPRTVRAALTGPAAGVMSRIRGTGGERRRGRKVRP